MRNQCQPDQGHAVSLNRQLKYLVPTPARERRGLWQYGAGQSTKRALRHAPLCRGNWGANLLFRKAVPEKNTTASAFCGWQHQERRDNQMAAQHGRESESTKRHHTAKRMIFVLHHGMRFGSNRLNAKRNSLF
jgi:hypothetical protein